MTHPRGMVFASTVDASARTAAPVSRASLTGCPWHDTKDMLRQVGLRPTRQRMALGWLLFAKGDRHLTAETEVALQRRMHFPQGWDPFFRETMTLQDVYHYGTQHFAYHQSQLTLTELQGDRAQGSRADG